MKLGIYWDDVKVYRRNLPVIFTFDGEIEFDEKIGNSVEIIFPFKIIINDKHMIYWDCAICLDLFINKINWIGDLSYIDIGDDNGI